MVIKCKCQNSEFLVWIKNCYNYRSHEHCLVKSSKKMVLQWRMHG